MFGGGGQQTKKDHVSNSTPFLLPSPCLISRVANEVSFIVVREGWIYIMYVAKYPEGTATHLPIVVYGKLGGPIIAGRRSAGFDVAG